MNFYLISDRNKNPDIRFNIFVVSLSKFKSKSWCAGFAPKIMIIKYNVLFLASSIGSTSRMVTSLMVFIAYSTRLLLCRLLRDIFPDGMTTKDAKSTLKVPIVLWMRLILPVTVYSGL